MMNDQLSHSPQLPLSRPYAERLPVCAFDVTGVPLFKNQRGSNAGGGQRGDTNHKECHHQGKKVWPRAQHQQHKPPARSVLPSATVSVSFGFADTIALPAKRCAC
jgi:hypothetical protein